MGLEVAEVVCFVQRVRAQVQTGSVDVGDHQTEALLKRFPADGSGHHRLVLLHKAVVAATIGRKSFEEGFRLVIAHIDSPRLDLRPNPLYEANQDVYKRQGWQLEMLNLNETELGGVKEAIFSVDGAGAYNRLK